MYIGYDVKYSLFLSYFNEILSFRDKFLKNSQISNFIKIRPLGGELFHATDRRTDIDEDRHGEANSHFSQFCELA